MPAEEPKDVVVVFRCTPTMAAQLQALADRYRVAKAVPLRWALEDLLTREAPDIAPRRTA